jgi:type 1 fimbria pilin
MFTIMAFKKYALAAVILAAISGSAIAADAPSDTGTITFHGLVNPNTCLITMTGDSTSGQTGVNNNDFDVTLATVNVADFTTNKNSANSVTSSLGETAFNLNVKCDGAKNIATVKAQLDPWGGSTASNDGLLVPPTNLMNAAGDVALVLKDGAGAQVKMGQANGTTTPLTSGEAQLDYTVAYSGPATATSGMVQAQVAFTMDYE